LTLCGWIGGTFTIAGGVELRSAVLVGVGLAAFGLGLGCAEVAFNIDGAEVERLLGRPILPFLHGAFSIGTLLGGGAGIWLAAINYPPASQLAIAGGIAVVVAVAVTRDLPPGFAVQAQDRSTAAGPRAWRDGRVVRIALIVLVLALAEGTANDWLPLVMVDGHGLEQSTSSIVYTTFAAAMAAGRFAGPAVLARFPRVGVVATSGCFAALGLLGVVFSPSLPLAYAAVVLWGLGAALGFPVSISAAAEGDAATAPSRVGVVATTGYIGFLVGPPMLGLLGDHFGLRQSLVIVLALVLTAVVLAPAVRPLATNPATTAQKEKKA
ncbi:MAG: MFS transporter, partial [Propionicimonas sp.]|nr:MFS transporter [Propionicimonas sp.]